jgi:valyl-tRNA synthetase
VNEIEVFVQLADAKDDAAEEERLRKELAELESQVARLESLLASPFAQKAPEKIVQAEREKLETYKGSIQKLRSRLG